MMAMAALFALWRTQCCCERVWAAACDLLREALLAGEFERGRAPEITGYQERQAGEILAVLLQKRMLISTGPRSPLRLGFPIDVIARWFPTLCPVS